MDFVTSNNQEYGTIIELLGRLVLVRRRILSGESHVQLDPRYYRGRCDGSGTQCATVGRLEARRTRSTIHGDFADIPRRDK